MQPSYNLSSELLICRHHDGVRVMRPDDMQDKRYGHALSPIMSLAESHHLPFNTYFHTTDSIIYELNEICWITTGWHSKKDAINNSIRTVCTDQGLANRAIQNDRQVMQKRKLQIFDEHAEFVNDTSLQCVSFKMPWYNDNHQVIGVFGCSVSVDQNDCADIANQLAAVNQLLCATPVNPLELLPGKEWDNNYFSTRELEVIRLVVRGKTLREIANALGLSQRTVESYFLNIKTKANVSTKSELIEKIIGE